MSDVGGHQGGRVMYLHLRAALARAAMQAYFVLNGAAAIALLAFLGDLSTKPAAETRLVADLGLIKFAIMAFTGGVCLSASTYLVAFMVHNNYIAGRNAVAERLRTFGVFVAIMALLLFVIGNVISARAIGLR
jgi:hypothetical protein